MKTLMHLSICSLLFAAGCGDSNQPRTEAMPQGSNRSTAADNTAVNVRDRGANVKTPMDQKENKNDISTTADIRKRVVDTKMSMDAHNIKIITQDGHVTLRGPVQSAAERQQIHDIAADVAGKGNLDDQLEVVAAR